MSVDSRLVKMTRNKVFVCYSHKDRAVKDDLGRYLQHLGEEAGIDYFEDGRLRLGEAWRGEIEGALDRTKVGILLVSMNFANSAFIKEIELPSLLEAARRDDAEILPIRLEPLLLRGRAQQLEGFQFLPAGEQTLDGLDDAGRKEIWKKLLLRIEELLPRPISLVFHGANRAEAENLATALEEKGSVVRLQDWVSDDEADLAACLHHIQGNCSVILLVGKEGAGIWERDALSRELRKKLNMRPAIPAIGVFLCPWDELAENDPLRSTRLVPDYSKFYLGTERTRTLASIQTALTGEEKRERPRHLRRAEAPRRSGEPEPRVSTPDDGDPFRPGERPPSGRTGRSLSGESSSGDGREDPSMVEKAARGAIHRLLPLLGEENLTLYVGPSAVGCGALSPPRPFQLSRALLQQLGIIDSSYDRLLPPFDVVANYYSVDMGDDNLDAWVRNRIGPPRRVPPVTRRLAQLVKLLRSGNAAGPSIVIVTTNFDLLLERALLEECVPFTRIVQYRDCKRIDVNEYQEVVREGRKIRLTTALNSVRGGMEHGGGESQTTLSSPEELKDKIAMHGRRGPFHLAAADRSSGLQSLPAERFTSPLVYKFHGSQDLKGSCAISADQYLEFSRGVSSAVPEKILEYIDRGPIVILGYHYSDPDFRIVCKYLMDTRSKRDRFACQLPPERSPRDDYRRMERSLWEAIKLHQLEQLKIRTLEVSGQRFLKHLIAAVESRGSASSHRSSGGA